MLNSHRAWHRWIWRVIGPLVLIGLGVALAVVKPRPAEELESHAIDDLASSPRESAPETRP